MERRRPRRNDRRARLGEASMRALLAKSRINSGAPPQ